MNAGCSSLVELEQDARRGKGYQVQMGGTWSSGPETTSAELEELKEQLAASQAEAAALRAGTAAGRALSPLELQLTALFARLEAAEAAAGIVARKPSAEGGGLPRRASHRGSLRQSSSSSLLCQLAGFEAERGGAPEVLYQYETTAATRASLADPQNATGAAGAAGAAGAVAAAAVVAVDVKVEQ